MTNTRIIHRSMVRNSRRASDPSIYGGAAGRAQWRVRAVLLQSGVSSRSDHTHGLYYSAGRRIVSVIPSSAGATTQSGFHGSARRRIAARIAVDGSVWQQQQRSTVATGSNSVRRNWQQQRVRQYNMLKAQQRIGATPTAVWWQLLQQYTVGSARGGLIIQHAEAATAAGMRWLTHASQAACRVCLSLSLSSRDSFNTCLFF
jgi:hypothetical protein